MRLLYESSDGKIVTRQAEDIRVEDDLKAPRKHSYLMSVEGEMMIRAQRDAISQTVVRSWGRCGVDMRPLDE